MGKTINTVGGGGSSQKSVLEVTVSRGTAASVTATKSGQTIALTYDSTNQVWTALISSMGTWLVFATDGTRTTEGTITVEYAAVCQLTLTFYDVPTSEYVQLEYIEGTALVNNFIDTELKPISANRIEGEFQFPYSVLAIGSSAQVYPVMVGAVSNFFFYIQHRADGGVSQIKYNSTRLSTSSVTVGTADLNKKKYNAKDNTIVFAGNIKTLPGTLITTNTSNNAQLFFSFGQSGSPLTRHYSFSIWNTDDTEKICNLIPAKRKSDNVLGMYDNVRNLFLTASGTLTAGPEV